MASGSVDYIDNITATTAEAYYSLSGVSSGYFNIQKNGTGSASSYSISNTGYYLYLSGLDPSTQYKAYLSWYEGGVQKFSGAYWFTTQAQSVTGTITISDVTSNSATCTVSLTQSNASSVYLYNFSTGDWTRIAYSSWATSYSYTKTGLTSGTEYGVYLYDSTDDNGNLLASDTFTTTSIYTYYLTLYGNGGTWTGGATYIDDYATSPNPSYTFDLTAYTEPTRDGYDFAGWYTAQTGGTRVTQLVVYSSGEVWAHWTQSTYSYTITYYPNGGTGSSITDTVTGSSSTFNTYLRGLTYTKAYNTQTGWHESASVTHGLGDLISISGNKSMYATWTHDSTSNFYWFGNDTADWNAIDQGLSVTNLTANAWKTIGTKINNMESLLGDTQTSFTRSMTSGSVFRASYFNEVTQALRRIINNHSLNISAPSDTQKGNRLFYYLFNGSASIKQCLNNIIQWYNTR